MRRIPTRHSVSVSADMAVADLLDDGGMDVSGMDGRAESGRAALISEILVLGKSLAERDTRLAALAARLGESNDQLAERDNRLADLTDTVRELQNEIRLPGNCRAARTRSRPGWPSRCAGTGK